jgi:hypothetical protein
MLEPDIQVVGEAIDAVDILLKIGRTNADAVAIDLPPSGKDAGLSSHILAEYPDVRIFAVSKGGDRIFIYETAVFRRETSQTSLESLGKVIRSIICLDNGWVRLPR